MKSLKITAGGAISVETIPDLEGLQAAVGGYIEILSLDELNELVLNEEGKLYGLPFNHVASVLTVKMDVGLQPGDFIVGDVVIVGAPDPDDDEGSRRDFDPRILATLEQLGFPTS